MGDRGKRSRVGGRSKNSPSTERFLWVTATIEEAVDILDSLRDLHRRATIERSGPT
jgi:hypothetical protein